jgi:hypothetical protein
VPHDFERVRWDRRSQHGCARPSCWRTASP